jgi:hypothetical protein
MSSFIFRSTALIFVFTFTFQLYSQKTEYEFEFGKVESNGLIHSSLKFIGEQDGYIYFSSAGQKKEGETMERQKIILFRHKPDLTYDFAKEINMLKAGRPSMWYEETYFFGDQLLMFFNRGYKRPKRVRFYMQTVDPSTFELTGEARLLKELDFDYFNLKKPQAGEIEVSFSRDNEKMLCLMHQPDFKQRHKESIYFQVYNSRLETVNEGTIQAKEAGHLVDLTSMDVDDEGNVYVLLQHFGQQKMTFDIKPNYNYELRAYPVDGSAPSSQTIDFGDEFISEIEVIATNSGVICTGFTSKENKDRLGGFFYMFTSWPGDTPLVNVKHALSLKALGKNRDVEENEKKIKQARRGKDHEYKVPKIRQVLFHEDGLTIIGEPISKFHRTSTNNFASAYSGYATESLLILNIDNDGSIKWMNSIEKYTQGASISSQLVSYSWDQHKDRLFFVFNDRIENIGLSLKEFKKLSTFFTSTIINMVEVSMEDGRILNRAPLYNENVKFKIAPLAMKTYIEDYDGMLLFEVTPSKYRFTRVQYK